MTLHRTRQQRYPAVLSVETCRPGRQLAAWLQVLTPSCSQQPKRASHGCIAIDSLLLIGSWRLNTTQSTISQNNDMQLKRAPGTRPARVPSSQLSMATKLAIVNPTDKQQVRVQAAAKLGWITQCPSRFSAESPPPSDTYCSPSHQAALEVAFVGWA